MLYQMERLGYLEYGSQQCCSKLTLRVLYKTVKIGDNYAIYNWELCVH